MTGSEYEENLRDKKKEYLCCSIFWNLIDFFCYQKKQQLGAGSELLNILIHTFQTIYYLVYAGNFLGQMRKRSHKPKDTMSE